MRTPRRSPAWRGRGAPLAALTRILLCLAFIAGAALTAGGSHAASPTALRILSTSPSLGATDVPGKALLSVTFDRPVVSLNDVGVANAHVPAQLSPRAPGHGEWITTTTWVYQLTRGLDLGTRYQVMVSGGFSAQDGSRLPGPYTFSFTTMTPSVSSVAPVAGTQFSLPQDLVQMIFDVPVQRASAQDAFSLRANGVPVPGTFSWNGKAIATQPNGAGAVAPPGANGGPPPPPAPNTVMTFHPAHLLPLGASMQATLAAGVRGTVGPIPMAAPYTWGYRVTGTLSVAGTTPTNGQTKVNANPGIAFNFSVPISQRRAQTALSISPKPDYQYSYVNDAGTMLTVSGDFKPSTSYTLTINNHPLGTAGQALTAPYVLRFTTQPATPSISLVSQGQSAVYDAYLGAKIYAHVVNVASVNLTLYRLTADQFLGLSDNPPNNWQGTPPAGAPLVAQWSLPSSAKLNQSLLVRQPLAVAGRPMGPGYYLMNANGDNASDHLLVLITRTAVTMKIGQQQAFIWATDLKTGKPVGGEAVRVIDSKHHVWATGATNAQGIFQATVHGLPSQTSLAQLSLQAQLSHGIDVSAADLNWNNGIGPWDYNLPNSLYETPIRLYLTTERPIYRPGQSIYFKGIARRDNDGRYGAIPAGTPVQVQIQDARQNMIYNTRLTVGAFGAFDGKVPLSPAAPVGAYQISAGIGVSNVSGSFLVAQYKKPSYAVSVISDRGANANYTQGDKIGVQVRSHYYFGAPLTHASVKWNLTQNDYTFNSPLFPDYAFVDEDYAATQQQTFFGQQTTEGSGSTDSHGDFHFTVPADIHQYQLSQQYTLEATLTGPDAQQVSDNTQVIVHKAGLYVGIRPADYVSVAGKPAPIRLVTVADDGIHTVGGVRVTAQVYKRVWLSSFVLDSSGFSYWQDRHRDTLVGTIIAHTNSQGRAVFNYTPTAGGEYRIVASALDGAGRKATTSTSLWVVSAGESYVPWQTQNNDRIRLVADKNTYKPGDVAHILVTAPMAGMTALVTVERGSILSHQVVTLPTNSSQVNVPILGYYAPDVYVSITLVKGPGMDTNGIPVWRMGYVSLPVDTSGQSLHVAIHASVGKASPGQSVTYTIHTTNAKGQGVQAQLAVSLVDKAVLALAAGTTPSLMDTFYSSRDLGIMTSATLNQYIDRLNLDQKVGAKGGSGGGGGGQGPTRQNFPDTAYWNPSVVTDANGNASVTITLPDNLTTWTLTALGGTEGALVGQNSMDLISSKDLLLEPALPNFLTVGDTAASGAVVNNLTSNSQQVRVTLHTTNGAAVGDYQSVVDVPAGDSRLVQWPVRAGAVGSQS
ncbi:MAG TPA: Ig-like domain-containing protein, partial [Chloroflexota bacterium]|nr:Ig-like domain-containing protein [Chloroflexota bacterium]